MGDVYRSNDVRGYLECPSGYRFELARFSDSEVTVFQFVQILVLFANFLFNTEITDEYELDSLYAETAVWRFFFDIL